jgi:hypothetical protein
MMISLASARFTPQTRSHITRWYDLTMRNGRGADLGQIRLTIRWVVRAGVRVSRRAAVLSRIGLHQGRRAENISVGEESEEDDSSNSNDEAGTGDEDDPPAGGGALHDGSGGGGSAKEGSGSANQVGVGGGAVVKAAEVGEQTEEETKAEQEEREREL